MKINEILANKRTLSFEVFPPKKAETEMEGLFATINELKKYKPDFISVTYGAGGSNARSAVEISGHLKSVGIEPLAHLTGGPSSPAEIDRVAGGLKALGVENVLALRGDKPQDFTREYCKHFPHATDLIAYLQKYGFATGAACYPEGHVESGTLYDDLKNLKKKEECGASFFISQIFYDNSYYYRLVDEARKLGITSPIIPGIMPLVSANNLKRIQAMCGSTLPAELRYLIETYGENPAVMREIGMDYAVYQITDLISNGAPGVHLYIMNRAETASEIYARLPNSFHELF